LAQSPIFGTGAELNWVTSRWVKLSSWNIEQLRTFSVALGRLANLKFSAGANSMIISRSITCWLRYAAAGSSDNPLAHCQDRWRIELRENPSGQQHRSHSNMVS
jgi:hypothetical protein